LKKIKFIKSFGFFEEYVIILARKLGIISLSKCTAKVLVHFFFLLLVLVQARETIDVMVSKLFLQSSFCRDLKKEMWEYSTGKSRKFWNRKESNNCWLVNYTMCLNHTNIKNVLLNTKFVYINEMTSEIHLLINK
jgi:hypothetical protein